MGTPEFACASLAALAASHHKVLAVVTGPDKPAGRGRKLTACEVKIRATGLNLPLFQPENLRDDSFVAQMATLKADVFVVIAFRILPKKLYVLPPYGSINIHGSLLPRYRGAAPINHALLNGETETGLTSFFLTDRVDQGNIIHQVATSIGPDENFTSLYNRLSEMAGPFLLESLDLISQPGFAPKNQDESLASPAPKISPEDGLIDWTKDRRAVHNHIRAYSEKPGAFCFLDDLQIKILATHMTPTSDLPHLDAGELLVTNKKLFVGAGDGPLEITKVLPQGKKALDALSFINGYRIASHRRLLTHGKEVNK